METVVLEMCNTLQEVKMSHVDVAVQSNTLCLCPQILQKHCFQFLLGLTIVLRENKNNAYAKWGHKQRVLRYFAK